MQTKETARRPRLHHRNHVISSLTPTLTRFSSSRSLQGGDVDRMTLKSVFSISLVVYSINICSKSLAMVNVGCFTVFTSLDGQV
jgi:hypothetical protein